MWKIAIFLLIFFPRAYDICYSQNLDELKADFPYGLLTDDFGILNKEDMNINTCIATAEPFSEDSHSYPYWQCFKSKTSHLICEGKKYDLSEKKRMTLLILSTKLNGETHEYLYRRMMPLLECHLFQKEWYRLLKGQEHVCVSGPLISVKKNNNEKTWSWFFDRYKTKNGWDGTYLGSCMPHEKNPLLFSK
jgi:hypothetical protein